MEWVGKGFKRRPHRPAFEIIFVYSQNDGTLDIYLTGDRKPVPDLQAIFADTILKTELGPDEKDERVYDLNPLRSRQFQFVYGPESGIADVAVKKLRLTVLWQESERIVLEADPTYNRQAVFDLLDKVAKGFRRSQMAVTQVGIKVTFAHNPTSRKASTRSLRYQLAELVFSQARRARPHHPQDAGRFGIEPKEPAKDMAPRHDVKRSA